VHQFVNEVHQIVTVAPFKRLPRQQKMRSGT